jgi:chorismate mutase
MNKIVLATSTLFAMSIFSVANADVKNQDGLIPYRDQINKIDNNIIKLIGERNKVVLEVAKYKKQHDIAIYAPDREAKLKMKHAKMAEKYNVDPQIVNNVFDEIINHSKYLERTTNQ